MYKIKKTRIIVFSLFILSIAICGYACGFSAGQAAQAVEVEPEKAIVEISSDYVYTDYKSLGEFVITYYCDCEKCTIDGDGITATGTVATEGRTVAVDPSVIPYGMTVIIDGHAYVAEDCGGAIKGRRIDIFMESLQKALEAGVKVAEVYEEV